MAASVRTAVGAGGRGGVVRRVWASSGATAQPAATTASAAQATVGRLVVERRVVEVGVVSNLAALALE